MHRALTAGALGADWRLEVTTGSRLSFTMLDLNGQSGRRNGVAALYVRWPRFRARIAISEELAFVGDTRLDPEYELESLSLVSGLMSVHKSPGVAIEVLDKIPPHSGFGAKTNTLLGIAWAYVRAAGIETSIRELAAAARRGGTGGASVNLFQRGGYHVDGGHANPADFASDPHKYLVSSNFSQPAPFPPSLVSIPFPEWPIVVILPRGRGLHGSQEAEWFRSVTPIPQNEAEKSVHMAVFGLAAAIAESDYEAFCSVVRRISESLSFKRAQVSSSSPQAQLVLSTALDHGFDAIGMSSMGAMCYGFTKRLGEVSVWLDQLKNDGVIKDYWVTHARNSGSDLLWV
jgi:beta-ribofuranosylaminobenzene 5'-phosphate synthase